MNSRGLSRAELPLIGKGQPAATYTVRLYFMAPEGDQPGRRVFDVKLQGQAVVKDFDPVAKSGGPQRAYVHELHDIPVTENLVLEMTSSKAEAAQQPILSGIEVLRTNAREIVEQVAAR